jgi:plastocyanin
MRARRVLEQRGVVAAVVAVAGTAAVGVAGAAGSSGAAAEHKVYAVEDSGIYCFSTNPTTCGGAVELDVSGAGTGDTVIWEFSDEPYDAGHNAASRGTNWSFSTGAVSNPHDPNPDRRTFTQNGTYEFVCDAHPQMAGTITVTGGTDPTTSPTATATATPTPSPQPSDPGTNTPPPTGGTDAVKPTLRSIGAKGKRRAVMVTFRLSENATVTIRVKRGRKVVKSVTKQIAAGKRTVSVRSSKLKKGRYKVEVRARDANGNVSTLASKSLRIKK